MKKQKTVRQASKLYASRHRFIVLLTILLASIIFLLLLSQWQLAIFSPKPVLSPTPTFPIVYVPSPTYSPPTPTLPPQTFVSTKLGVRFDYANVPDYTATEIGNKVCIHNIRLAIDSRFCSLEVFDKSPTDTIADVIKKQFLQGYEKDCQVMIRSGFMSNRPSTFPGTYTLAQISGNPCPAAYSGQLRYFLTDTNRPNKLVFIHIAESDLGSGRPDEGWYQTIRFVDTP